MQYENTKMKELSIKIEELRSQISGLGLKNFDLSKEIEILEKKTQPVTFDEAVKIFNSKKYHTLVEAQCCDWYEYYQEIETPDSKKFEKISKEYSIQEKDDTLVLMLEYSDPYFVFRKEFVELSDENKIKYKKIEQTNALLERSIAELRKQWKEEEKENNARRKAALENPNPQAPNHYIIDATHIGSYQYKKFYFDQWSIKTSDGTYTVALQPSKRNTFNTKVLLFRRLQSIKNKKDLLALNDWRFVPAPLKADLDSYKL